MSDAGRTADDEIQPFMLEASGIRGRLLRLGPLAEEIITTWDHAEPTATLLGEILALGGVLSSTLKYDGIFTLQVKGDGPIRTLMMDATSQGELRAFAGPNAEAMAEAGAETAEPPFDVPTWLGKGYMAFTVDQGPDTERYQGIVELTGARLSDCLLHYFRQSEQINSGIVLSCARTPDAEGTPRWRAGALLIQRVPEDGSGEVSEASEEDWRRALILASSCTEEELLDPKLPANALLYRLFHEEGVRVFEPRLLAKGCRCDTAKVENIIRSLPGHELDHYKIDGEVVLTCEFCNIAWRFDDRDIAALKADLPEGHPQS